MDSNKTRHTTESTFFEWTESLSIGNSEIDGHHKTLIGLVNDLYHAMTSDSDSVNTEEILLQLEEYTVFHFQREEELMAKVKFKGLSAHKVFHANMISWVGTVRARLEAGKKINPDEILAYLKNWLVSHIMKSDMEYKSLLTGK